MKHVIIHSSKYGCSAEFEKDGLFIERLAKLLIKMMVENNNCLKNLPEVQTVILKFMPFDFKTAVERCIEEYFFIYDEMELEGFIMFRLREQAGDLGREICKIVRTGLCG